MFLEGTRRLPGPPGEGSAAASGRAMRSLSLASEARLVAHVVRKDCHRSLGRRRGLRSRRRRRHRPVAGGASRVNVSDPWAATSASPSSLSTYSRNREMGTELQYDSAEWEPAFLMLSALQRAAVPPCLVVHMHVYAHL